MVLTALPLILKTLTRQSRLILTGKSRDLSILIGMQRPLCHVRKGLLNDRVDREDDNGQPK